MFAFDPDEFLVTGDQPMTRVIVPGKPYAAYGYVRDVWISEDDLPFRMVCFTLKDLAIALQYPQNTLNKRFGRWGWDKPKYKSEHAYMLHATKGLVWYKTSVYTYPEAAMILSTYEEQIVTFPKGFGRKSTPSVAKLINDRLAEIRQEIEITNG